MRYAVISGSLVTNVILWDGTEEYVPEEGCSVVEAPDEVAIGWGYSNGSWVPPSGPEPDPVAEEDPEVEAAKHQAVSELVALGVSENTARTIVGLPTV